MKFFEALKNATFAGKLFAAANFDFAAALKANDENALKTHIEGLVSAASTESAEVETALSEAVSTNSTLSAKVTELEGKLSAANANATNAANYVAVTEALAANGVKIAKPDELKAALEARISVKARELLAATGTTPLSDAPADDATKPGAAAKTMARSDWAKLSPQGRAEFIRKGGQLTE
jgi:hypothetical protein